MNTEERSNSPYRHLFGFLFVIFVVLACHLPMVLAVYGYCDDYPQLVESRNTYKWLETAMQAAGRPVGAVLAEYSFRAAGTVEGLSWLRGLTVLIVLGFGWLLWKHLQNLGVDSVTAGLATAFVCSLPSFSIYVGWAALWLYLLPAVFTWYAYKGVRLEGQESRRYLRVAGAVLILFVCFNIYPPATPFFWFWAVIELALDRKPVRVQARRLAVYLACFVTSGALYYGVYKLAGFSHPRSSLTGHPIAKLKWMATEVIPTVSRLHWPEWSGWLLPVLVLALALIPWFGWKASARNSDWAKRLIAFPALLCLCYLPLLAVKEFEVTYRNQIVLSATIGCLALMGLAVILVRFLPLRIAQAILGAVLLFAAGLALQRGVAFAGAQAAEFNTVKQEIARSQPTGRPVTIIQADGRKWFESHTRDGEFGLITSIMDPSYSMSTAMVALIIRDNHFAAPPSIRELPADAIPPTSNELVINLNPLAVKIADR